MPIGKKFGTLLISHRYYAVGIVGQQNLQYYKLLTDYFGLKE